MSLVASIFGSVTTASDDTKKKKQKNEALVSLFDANKQSTKETSNDGSDTSGDDDDSSSASSSSASSSSSSSSRKEDKDDNNSNKEVKDDHKQTVKDDHKQTMKDDDTQKADTGDDTQKKRKKRKEKKEDNETTQKTNTETPEKDDSNDDPNAQAKKDEQLRTVFVGNLPLSTTRRSLAKVFAECGKVQSTRLRSVAVAGVKIPANRAGDQKLVKKVCTFTKQLDVDAKSSLQGYVVFLHPESVVKALRLNNKALQDEDPKATRAIRRIRVDTASPTLDPKRSVFVGNLPYQADEATLQDHFVRGCALDIADVQGVRIIRDKETFQCKGFGYILFQDSTMVATALQKMEESVYMKRPLRVKVCGKSIKGRRGEVKTKKRKSEKSWDGGNGASFGGAGPDDSTSNTTSSSNKRPRPTLEGGKLVTLTATPVAGAMRRVAKKNKRARGEKKKSKGNTPGVKPGVSKRAAADSKADKRVKKLERRVSKGMGKARK